MVYNLYDWVAIADGCIGGIIIVDSLEETREKIWINIEENIPI